MTNQHIQHSQGLITDIWKEEYITPFGGKDKEISGLKVISEKLRQ